jgi:hypothetical protein
MKASILVSALMVSTAGLAAAGPGGLNLGWNDCGGIPASLNQTFACNTNVGALHTLVGSFVAPCCVTAMSGNEIVMNLQSAGASLPAWWQMASGLCRPGSLFSGMDFTAGPFTCLDYWQGQAVNGHLLDQISGNRARIRVIGAIPELLAGPVVEGTEVYSYKLNINNAKTVGSACTGCQTGVCIVLNSILIDQPLGTPGGNKFVSTPAVRNYALWQGGTGGDCLQATPTRNATWGSIKAQYR